MVDINRVYVNPPQVRAGQQINLSMDYTILTPDNAPVNSTLYREIRLGGSMVGQPYQTQVTNANGTYHGSGELRPARQRPTGDLHRHQPGDEPTTAPRRRLLISPLIKLKSLK